MLYDLLTILFTQVRPLVKGEKRVPAKEFKTLRKPESAIEDHTQFATEFFGLLGGHFEPVGKVFGEEDHAATVAEERHGDGGHVLFRPVGQKIFVQVFAHLCAENSLQNAMARLSLLPTDLCQAPYASVIWDCDRKTMVTSSTASSLCRDVLLHMLGEKTRRSTDKLRQRYCDFLGEPREAGELPEPIA